VQAAATPQQKKRLARLSPRQFRHAKLAGEKIEAVLDRAPGNGAPIGGLKVIARSGWFAVRPSGTEDIYKIYAESFRGGGHLDCLVEEARTMVDAALATKRRIRASPRRR
jgi:phosphoglucomutase